VSAVTSAPDVRLYLVFGVGSQAERAHGPAMEAALERDQAVLAARWVERLAPLARKLDGALVRLGAAVTEEDLLRKRLFANAVG